MRKNRIFAPLAIATLSWGPLLVQPVSALYCYPGDPPAVYQACLAYSGGIGQQVNNQNQLQNIQGKMNGGIGKIKAIDTLIGNLKRQIAAQQALIAETQAAIDDLNRQIRFGEANLTRLVANTSVRDELLNQRLRYIDSHGTLNYAQLVLTASNFNQMMDRMIAAQQVPPSDRKLLNDLAEQHSQVSLANSALDDQKSQVTALLQQQQATEVDLQNNVKAQNAALAAEQQLELQLSAQYAAVQAERAAIDAQVAQLAVQYQAAAAKAGGGSGVFEWPQPACRPGGIKPRFGCSPCYLDAPGDSCPWPHKIHTGLDIAGPYGTNIVAADTGVVYLYPGSVGYGNLLVMFHGNGYSTYYRHTAGYAPGLRSGDVLP